MEEEIVLLSLNEDDLDILKDCLLSYICDDSNIDKNIEKCRKFYNKLEILLATKTYGKFILESRPSFKKKIEMWNNLGFLDGLKNNDIKNLVGAAYEVTNSYLSTYKKYTKDIELLIFPVIRRIFGKTKKTFDYEMLVKSIHELIDNFSEECKKETLIFKDMDENAKDQFLKNFCDNYKL